METVIVTAWQRPDFFQAALDRLLVADEPGNLQYLLALDRRHDKHVFTVALGFQRKLGPGRVHIQRRSHQYPGNSFNVLTSYREAVAAGPELVHLVEEDILVGIDYFKFHRAAHAAAPDAFCVSACRNQFYPVQDDPPGDPTAVYLHRSYQSLGVSFRPERLREALQHAGPRYFANPVGYCRRHFPGSLIPPANAEQDGLINRVIEASGAATAYPASPRAYHVGFAGYHRNGQALIGTVAERAAQIVGFSTADLNKRAYSYPDHQAVPLDAERPPVNRLVEWPAP